MEYKVYKKYVKPGDKEFAECKFLCGVTRDLYNKCLYSIRQYYFTYNSFSYEYHNSQTNEVDKVYVTSNNYMYHLHKNDPEFRTTDINGDTFNTKVLKQVYIQVSRQFYALTQAWSAFYKNPKDFNNVKPKLPNYKGAKQLFMCRHPADAIKKSKLHGHVRLSSTNIDIPLLNGITKSDIREVLITPLVYGFEISVCYKIKEEKEIPDIESVSKIMGIDLGMNNLCTLTSNDSSFKPIIINGRPLKSVNQYYFKTKAEYQQELPKGVTTSNKIKQLTQKRNFKNKDYMHKVSSFIVEEAIKNNIECIVCGYNPKWKQSINIGKRNNQNFCSIPFYTLISMLQYKCKQAGILFITSNESHTSVCSFLDLEPIKHHDNYCGSRVKRGLFKSANGDKINADVNGSYNIIRKVFGDEFFTYTDKYINLPVRKRNL